MNPYRFDVLSISPECFESFRQIGIIGRSLSKGIAELNVHNPRDFAYDKYHKVDDEPYGGGVGMLLKPEPMFLAFESIPKASRRRVIMMTPQGSVASQFDLKRWSNEYEQLVVFCGQYEGFDERIRSLVDEEISIGDLILTGGELPAMTLINGVVRLLPGTVGDEKSLEEESHTNFLLEHPQYTRPANFREMKVPDILRSGDHGSIAEWRYKQKVLRTKERRPDLYKLWFAKEATNRVRIESSVSNDLKHRIGNGYDIHRLVPGRALVLGGVKLEHPEGLGLDGHSDADVLVHALMDALLGALALGDIGKYFPPDDSEWKDADSLFLLKNVVSLIRSKGWNIINIDSVVIAERPKLKPHIELMRSNIADCIGIGVDAIGVKATTNESLGPEGREEGISSHAVVLLGKE